jgi:hypothetical protein
MIAPPTVINTAPAHTGHAKRSPRKIVAAISVSGIPSALIGYATLKSIRPSIRVHNKS